MAKYGQTSHYDVVGEWEGSILAVDGIKISIPYPKKTAIIRYPTPEETLAFFENSKAKDLTREERAEAFFDQLRLDKSGDTFDEFEAAAAIDSLTRSSADKVERHGNSYQITVKTPFGDTLHMLGIPTQRQLALFRRNAYKNYIKGVISFYDELVQSSGGYADNYPVPPHHKLDAINAVTNTLDAIDPTVSLDPNS